MNKKNISIDIFSPSYLKVAQLLGISTYELKKVLLSENMEEKLDEILTKKEMEENIKKLNKKI